MVKVDIGAFVEAMMRGVLGWWGDVVMDICEAMQMSAQLQDKRGYYCSQCQERYFALLWRHCVSLG
jgi:hypothetical protein